MDKRNSEFYAKLVILGRQIVENASTQKLVHEGNAEVISKINFTTRTKIDTLANVVRLVLCGDTNKFWKDVYEVKE